MSLLQSLPLKARKLYGTDNLACNHDKTYQRDFIIQTMNVWHHIRGTTTLLHFISVYDDVTLAIRYYMYMATFYVRQNLSTETVIEFQKQYCHRNDLFCVATKTYDDRVIRRDIITGVCHFTPELLGRYLSITHTMVLVFFYGSNREHHALFSTRRILKEGFDDCVPWCGSYIWLPTWILYNIW